MNQENPPTTKKEPLRCESGCEIQKNPEEIGTMARLTQALPPGKHPGFSNLPSKSGVYRCKLHFQANKLDPGHADFKGVLQLSGSKASVLVWIHQDGSLGLRLEKIEDRKNGANQTR